MLAKSGIYFSILAHLFLSSVATAYQAHPATAAGSYGLLQRVLEPAIYVCFSAAPPKGSLVQHSQGDQDRALDAVHKFLDGIQRSTYPTKVADVVFLGSNCNGAHLVISWITNFVNVAGMNNWAESTTGSGVGTINIAPEGASQHADATIYHEVGHTFGLNHPVYAHEQDSIMGSWAYERSRLAQDDLNGIVNFYNSIRSSLYVGKSSEFKDTAILVPGIYKNTQVKNPANVYEIKVAPHEVTEKNYYVDLFFNGRKYLRFACNPTGYCSGDTTRNHLTQAADGKSFRVYTAAWGGPYEMSLVE